MLKGLDLEKVLFMDIETVAQFENFKDLDENLQELWSVKAKSVSKKYDETLTFEENEKIYDDKAGIYSEFGKIICISVGYLYKNEFRLKSIYGDDEKELLLNFAELIHQHFGNPNVHYLCGHNIKEFDIPYICRRMVIHDIDLPLALNVAGKKPWEIKHMLDTMEMWKFGDYKNYTSLKLLTTILGLPSPKQDIDGSQVNKVYWKDNELVRIKDYCEKDVLAVFRVIQRFMKLPIIEDEAVITVV